MTNTPEMIAVILLIVIATVAILLAGQWKLLWIRSAALGLLLMALGFGLKSLESRALTDRSGLAGIDAWVYWALFITGTSLVLLALASVAHLALPRMRQWWEHRADEKTLTPR